ncbi:MAG TPA: HAD family hydrolase [Terriglobia bacterium]|nr:HAD family hydrolase [Terriglobia bacterium]
MPRVGFHRGLNPRKAFKLILSSTGDRERQGQSAFGPGAAIRLLFRDPPARGRTPAIFFDRDGVINQRVAGSYVSSWEEFQFLEGSVEALRALSRLRVPVLVISNQAGVAKGLVGRRALADITRRFVRALARVGARIDAAYYCPHVDRDACRCRKPQPGMLLQAARDWRLDLGRSVMVGDSLRDVEAGRRAGCRGILLDSQAEFGQAGLEGASAGLELQRIPSLVALPGCVARLLGRSR